MLLFIWLKWRLAASDIAVKVRPLTYSLPSTQPSNNQIFGLKLLLELSIFERDPFVPSVVLEAGVFCSHDID